MVVFNYITTNNLNGKQYVGMHSTKNVDDTYLGSGLYFNKAVKKYGRENFTREIICFCPDVSVAHYNEGIYIIEYNTLAPNGYNLSPKGGRGGVGCLSERQLQKLKEPKSEVHKQRIREARAKQIITKETKEKLSIAKKGKPSPRKGVILSEETKQKMSTSMKGKLVGIVRSEETKQKMSDAKKGNTNCVGKAPWNKGKKFKSV